LNPPLVITEKQAFQSQLLSWYDLNQRALPWRGERDAYRVWLSEIMLQQTRVAAVIAYYQKFLQRFPTLQALASARLSSVLAAWSGLGYYRRARMLHQAAREIVKQHSGQFPNTAGELADLPGIGRYTAAAVASIAFDQPKAVVDGNVERILNRLSGSLLTTMDSWNFAEALLFHDRPGDFNQAMMELGATVCLPRDPNCLECPIRAFCNSRSRLKVVRLKPQRRKRTLSYALCRSSKGVLLVRRPAASTLMPGMWELPELSSKPTLETAAFLFQVRHSVTVTDYVVSVFEGNHPGASGKHFTPAQIARLPLTGLAKKILSRAAVI
jgi:A/G-specific adenine glycosylase